VNVHHALESSREARGDSRRGEDFSVGILSRLVAKNRMQNESLVEEFVCNGSLYRYQ